MLQLTDTTRYYWYNGVADMRKGFDSLCGMVSQFMGANVLDGGVFIFVNRRRNQIILLTWGEEMVWLSTISVLKKECMNFLASVRIIAAPKLMPYNCS
ncbi:MAG: IS66 family insertion sequence element accessory protein TnpB [Sphingobacteriales bacterium]|nr:IS66 family insertion sequence element accessory protein TnpB [Sphingobacteriales bacterium]